jgi:hypothetical protein
MMKALMNIPNAQQKNSVKRLQLFFEINLIILKKMGIFDPYRLETCEHCKSFYNVNAGCLKCAKRKRLEGIVCPCCKSNSIEEGGAYDTYNADDRFKYLFCLQCGIVFKNLKLI